MSKILTDEIIEKIYYSIETPDTGSDKNSNQTIEEAIMKMLDSKAHQLFRTYSDTWFDIVCDENRRGFNLGFRTGMKFFVEAVIE
ncbi:MAG: hypothetical protein FWE74_00960 [Oscillospiraceae bacterium]|nr:hypothetical protein [Oscillospiraceae bacterium]